MRALLFVILTILLSVALPVLPASAGDPNKLEKKIHVLTGEDRSENGKKNLRTNSCLHRMAKAHAVRQAKQERMFHQDLSRPLEKCGLASVGENVAYGFTSAGSVQKAWMNSQGHRANILNSSYRIMGVGTAKDASGTLYYAVLFGRKA